MSVNEVGSVTTVDAAVQVNSFRIRTETAQKDLPPAPASALALPIDTARAEVNMLAMAPAMLAPTADGLFVIGSVGVKAPSSAALARIRSLGSSSWGF